ncbi:Acyl-CoA reductase (LuxC) [Pustulibacterium marinum]|uniref:long-chain-fatty-acyl-CoA reductase n=1 Tax=Pustulibacterium marinum TaxID=1224947 RepID=A0A1I7IG47_9FLAO|nr:acyl-CoA reductase [Pustulibacterium marinum]SFU71820.1 Acyl-CoA reductase (LuxC) [Pustulibacterium marinum]
MNLNTRIDAFVTLGAFLRQFSNSGIIQKEEIACNNEYFDLFLNKIETAHHYNSWFNKEQVLFACESWANALTEETIKKWIDSYQIPEKDGKTVAIIMAGNIPLVGFHDFLSVLITGHSVVVKQSSNDNQLLPVLANYLMAIQPGFKNKIEFTTQKLPEFDAVIATGSNNTARYFEHYFGNKPNIIRKNRNSVAILTGEETQEDLQNLGEDIFRYYGLGCRSVSKLYVPEAYDFDNFFKAIYSYSDILNEQKYVNNYDYNKAVYLMSLYKLLENGFLMLKEDQSFGSPIATLFFERYENLETLRKELTSKSEQIQCIVGNLADINTVPFGETQKPQLWDYADNVDTVDFLLKIY